MRDEITAPTGRFVGHSDLLVGPFDEVLVSRVIGNWPNNGRTKTGIKTTQAHGSLISIGDLDTF